MSAVVASAEVRIRPATEHTLLPRGLRLPPLLRAQARVVHHRPHALRHEPLRHLPALPPRQTVHDHRAAAVPREDRVEVAHEDLVGLRGVAGLGADAEREVVAEAARAEDGVATGVARHLEGGRDVFADVASGRRGERGTWHARERLAEGRDLAVVRPACMAVMRQSGLHCRTHVQVTPPCSENRCRSSSMRRACTGQEAVDAAAVAVRVCDSPYEF